MTRPPSNEVEGEVGLTVAEHDTYRGTGWISGPLVRDTLYGYAGLAYSEYGGEYDNVRPGEGGEVGGEETTTLSGKLLWTPTENLDITVNLGYEETDDDPFAIALQGVEFNNCCERSAEAPRARGYYDGEAIELDNAFLYGDNFFSSEAVAPRRRTRPVHRLYR